MSLSRKALIVVPALCCVFGSLALADGPLTDWWATDADSPVGSRQRYHSGKQWPLESRPTGPCQPFMHRIHTSMYWPDPYRWDDRASVRAALSAQRVNGWIMATTLYEQHFDPVTNEINEAGKFQLRWILLHAPPDRRLTWVAAADDPTTSKTRLSSVQDESMLIAGRNVPPPMLRVCLPTATSAQDVDLIRRGYLSSIPAPRIPYIPLTSTSSSSGSSGSPQSGGSTPQGGTGR